MGSLAQHASGSPLAAPSHNGIEMCIGHSRRYLWDISRYPAGEAMPNVAALPGGVHIRCS